MTKNIYEIIDIKLSQSVLEYNHKPFKGEDGLYHFLYVITNKFNNRFYIGIHSAKTIRDSYRGSGKALKRAIKKYGFVNFSINRYVFFKNRESLSKAEGMIVTLELINQYSGIIYNLRTGGDYEFFDPNQGKRVKNHWYSNDEIGQAMRRGIAKAQANHQQYINSEKGLQERQAASKHMKELWQDPSWRAKMEEKKRLARLKHQKENPDFLKQCSDKARLVNMKPVAQALELYGAPVKIWDCQKNIPEEVINQTALRTALKRHTKYNGYYWYFYKVEDRVYQPLPHDIAKADKTLELLKKHQITAEEAENLKFSIIVSRTFDGAPELFLPSPQTAAIALNKSNIPAGYLNAEAMYAGLFWRSVHDNSLQAKQKRTLQLIEDFKNNRLEEWTKIEKQMGKRIKQQKVAMMADLNGEFIETFTSYSQAAFALEINPNQFSSTIRQSKTRYKGFYWKTVID